MGTPPKGEWVSLQRENGYPSKGGIGTTPKGEWVHLQRGMGTPPKGEWVLLQRGMGTPPKGNGYSSKGEWVLLQRGNGYLLQREWVPFQREWVPPPKGEWVIRTHINYLYSSRSSLAVSTIACRAALVSGQWRVLSPQSGFTHSCSLGTTLMAFFIKSVISCCDGTRGE